MARPQPSRAAALYPAFAVTGAVTVLLAPLLPFLTARYHLSDAEAGRLFAAQFLSSAAGAISLSVLGRRWPMERILAASYIAIAAALIALARADASLLPWCVALYGFPLGLTNPAASLILANSPSALNLLNVSWSLGAVLLPPLSSFLFWRFGETATLTAIAAIAAIAGLLCTSLRSRTTGPTNSSATPRPTGRDLSATVLTAAFLFFYVGAESSLSGWLPTHSQRHAGLHAALAGFTLSVFWIAIMAGRLFAGLRPGNASPRGWLFRGIALAAAGAALLVLLPNLTGLWMGAALAGFGLAPLFPTQVALYHQRAPRAAGLFLGPVFAAGALGGVVFPWLIGALSTVAGSLALSLALALAAIAALAALTYAQR